MQQKLSRQQRRDQERRSQKFNSRSSFSKEELEKTNEISYSIGVGLSLKAVAEVLGIGEVRLERVRTKIKELEFEHFHQLKPFDPKPFTEGPYEKTK